MMTHKVLEDEHDTMLNSVNLKLKGPCLLLFGLISLFQACYRAHNSQSASVIFLELYRLLGGGDPVDWMMRMI
jgi:hypothetical protein